MPINHLYHTWICQICELQPKARITRIRNFVWLMVGIYESRSCSSEQDCREDSRTSKAVEPDQAFEPLSG